MVKKTGSLTIEALAQAASNTLLAHIVSLAFLMVVTRKITQAYQKVRGGAVRWLLRVARDSGRFAWAGTDSRAGLICNSTNQRTTLTLSFLPPSPSVSPPLYLTTAG